MPPVLTLDDAHCQGTLTINGVLMHCPAWNVIRLVPLWLTPTVRGGPNRSIPGIVGRVAYRRRVDETAVSLPMMVSGLRDRTGAINANAWIGLQANIDYLRANVTDPTNATDGTRAATLVMPSGATRSANVEVLGMTEGNVVKFVQRFTLDLVIPAGGFV